MWLGGEFTRLRGIDRLYTGAIYAATGAVHPSPHRQRRTHHHGCAQPDNSWFYAASDNNTVFAYRPAVATTGLEDEDERQHPGDGCLPDRALPRRYFSQFTEQKVRRPSSDRPTPSRVPLPRGTPTPKASSPASGHSRSTATACTSAGSSPASATTSRRATPASPGLRRSSAASVARPAAGWWLMVSTGVTELLGCRVPVQQADDEPPPMPPRLQDGHSPNEPFGSRPR